MNSQIESKVVLATLSLLGPVVLASCASPMDAPYVCVDDAPSRQFDCASTQGPDWQLLPVPPANLDNILKIAKATAQMSIDDGDYISVPTQSGLESTREAVVVWFESDEGSLIACIPDQVRPTELLSIYSFPRENGDWATPSAFEIVNLCD